MTMSQQRTVPSVENAGVALLTVIIFIAMVGMFIAGLSTRLMIDKRQVDAFANRTLALHAAEYAAQTAFDKFVRDGAAAVGLDMAQIKLAADGKIGASLPSFNAPGVTPVDSANTPGAKFYAAVISWANDGRDNDGNGTADGPEELGIVSVFGVARAGKSARAIELTFRMDAGQSAAHRRLSWREIPPPAEG